MHDARTYFGEINVNVHHCRVAGEQAVAGHGGVGANVEIGNW
jgi:hypothetical protein